jgi:SAM-dependent methyltransferase
MSIQLINPSNGKPLVETETALRDTEGNVFPLLRGAFRMTLADNYTSSFGFQWNKFANTQIDRFQQDSDQSRERLLTVTGWQTENLKDKNILEVGSGAGRFSQVVLSETAANLYSVDYSDAVSANFKNNGPHPRLKLFQASIYELPFQPAQFDKVFCFGVLQHTPDFKQSVKALVDMTKPGGQLIVDFYPIRGWYTRVHAKYLLRPFTRKMNNEKLLAWIEKNADRLIAMSTFFDRVGLGRLINRFLPVCDIRTTIPRGLDKRTLREWVILDTFDMFSPEYDHPQRLETVVRWFKEFGMNEVEGKVISYGNENTVTVVKGIR